MGQAGAHELNPSFAAPPELRPVPEFSDVMALFPSVDKGLSQEKRRQLRADYVQDPVATMEKIAKRFAQPERDPAWTRLVVKTMTENQVELLVSAADTVDAVKLQVIDKECISTAPQDLALLGPEGKLPGDRTIEDCGIEEGGELELVFDLAAPSPVAEGEIEGRMTPVKCQGSDTESPVEVELTGSGHSPVESPKAAEDTELPQSGHWGDSGAQARVLTPAEQLIQVAVTTPKLDYIAVVLEIGDTIRDVKRKAKEVGEIGEDLEDIILTRDGDVLSDNNAVLSEYGVSDGSHLVMTLAEAPELTRQRSVREGVHKRESILELQLAVTGKCDSTLISGSGRRKSGSTSGSELQ